MSKKNNKSVKSKIIKEMLTTNLVSLKYIIGLWIIMINVYKNRVDKFYQGYLMTIVLDVASKDINNYCEKV